MKHRILPAAVLCVAAIGVGGFAQGVGTDHPAVSSYPGSAIRIHRQLEFEPYELAVTPAPGTAQHRRIPLEGKVTRIQYGNPTGRSAFEIFRNYEDALRKAGATTLFRCEPKTCGNWPVYREQRMINMGNQGYYALIARFEHNQRETHAVLAVSPGIHWIHIIESKEMEGGLVAVDAKAMAGTLQREGRISLYSILFDTGSAVMRPESQPAVAEIAKVLTGDPKLSLEIVGHTDNTGTPAGNEKLSAARAQAVVTQLVQVHGIAPARLKARGAGQSEPIAPNTTDEGRQKNRRVELVVIR
jgi:outer membrane protein OmpA-like peptidoglycan-associated protein